MKISSIIIFLTLLFTFNTQAQTYSSTLSVTDPTFNRPLSGEPPTTLSGVSTNVYYHVLTVPISVAGSYTFSAISVFDNWGILYNSAGFDPLNPLDNAIESDDDGAGGFDFEITETLAVGMYYLVVTSYSDGEIGDYTITTTGPAAVPLPLKLLDFKVQKTNQNNAQISWMTSHEKDIHYFEVQRSVDGIDFTKMLTIDPKNNHTETPNNYISDEIGLEYGKNIFRLKIVDLDGKVNYSNNKIINGHAKIDCILFPNPTKQQTHFSIILEEENFLVYKILDFTGRTYIEQKITVTKGKNVVSINTESLPTGDYVFTYNVGKQQGTIKFLKAN